MKKIIFKRIFTLALAAMFVLALVPLTVYANEDIKVTIDGEQVIFSGQLPVIVDGRTLVPVRGVFEQLGFEVSWNDSMRQATLTRGSEVVVITIGSAIFTANGANHTLDVPAQIIGGSTMLPLRGVLESVGYFLDWDAGTRTVLVSTNPIVNVSANVGDRIRFGSYYWRVLDIQGDYVLIITEDIVRTRWYHSTFRPVTWENSAIRQYLNNAFLNGFNESDRRRIRETTVINNDSPLFGTSGGNNTTDRIFLLSIEEVVRYFGDSGRLASLNRFQHEGIYDEYNTARIATNAAGPDSWWLRSPGFDEDFAATVAHNGEIFMFGIRVFFSQDVGFGIRPALWLNLRQ